MNRSAATDNIVSKQFKLLCLCLLVFILLLFTALVSAKDKNHEIFTQNSQQFQSLSAKVYKHFVADNSNRIFKAKDIKKLYTEVNILLNKQQDMLAIATIYNNLSILSTTIDYELTPFFIKTLINNQQWQITNTLYSAIEKNNRAVAASIDLYIAEHYLLEGNITQAENRLQALPQRSLSGLERNLFWVLQGIILQHRKKHREAIRLYQKVSPESKFYAYAQTNLAIAYIRQQWWSDAHDMLGKILYDKENKQQRELHNRLYTILGYSFLQKEFYRYARDAFRQVELDSQHTNRALLGTALSALGQQDYIGALNSLDYLKSQPVSDIYIDESHFLTPFAYRRLNQGTLASASYNEKINYFQARINSQQQLLAQLKNNPSELLGNAAKPYTTIENQRYDFGEHYPDAFFKEYAAIHNYKDNIKDSALLKEIESLKNIYDQTYSAMAKTLIEKNIAILNSYLSQSKFGLANLYDKQ